MEETGFEVEVIDIIRLIYTASRSYVPLQFIVRARITGGSLKVVADHESNKAVWIPLKQVIEELNLPESSKKYRRPYEIKPFIEDYLNKRTDLEHFIPLL